MTHDERRDELLERAARAKIKLNESYNAAVDAQRKYTLALGVCQLENEIIEEELRKLRVNAEGESCRASRHTLDPFVGSLNQEE